MAWCIDVAVPSKAGRLLVCYCYLFVLSAEGGFDSIIFVRKGKGVKSALDSCVSGLLFRFTAKAVEGVQCGLLQALHIPKAVFFGYVIYFDY